jgi:hypothetical protein
MMEACILLLNASAVEFYPAVTLHQYAHTHRFATEVFVIMYNYEGINFQFVV